METGTMRTKSLLSKTMAQFSGCAVAVFMLTAPLFYLLTRHYYAEDMIDIIESVKNGQGLPPIDLEQDIMAGVMLQFMLIFLAISLSLFVTMRFMTRRLWHPFDDTLQKAERFNVAQGELPSFMATGIREFERLNNSLKRLMGKDRDMYRIQKEFTENASHELQTPLAVIRSKLDLLMQENLTEKQMQLVSDLYEQAMRMSRLNRDLLLLAKIDNARQTVLEDVDIVGVISKSLPYMECCMDKDSGFRIENRQTDSRPVIKANPVLMECLIKNLAVNALRYSATGGEVRFIVEGSSLTVSNRSANGIPLDGALLFKRFGSGGIKERGNGLGLAIVKAVCDFHGWTVEYRFDEGCHLFTVTFL